MVSFQSYTSKADAKRYQKTFQDLRRAFFHSHIIAGVLDSNGIFMFKLKSVEKRKVQF